MQLITEQIQKSMEGSSWIRKMFEKGLELKTRYGADAVCDFSLGNPDVPPPAVTKDVLETIAADAVKPLGLGYCPNAGIPAVREAMAQYINRQQGIQDSEVRCNAGHVVMTVGAAGALVSFFRAVIEPGDEVVCPAPYFVEYASYCGHFGGVLKTVPSKSEDFSPDIEGLAAAITPKTRALLVNSPNNPTGAIYSAEVMAKIAKLVPLAKWSIVLGSFSKTLSLAGERIGYIALNPAMPGVETLAAAVTLTNRTLGYVNAPVIGQRLVAGLLDTTVDLGIYDRRRKLMAEVLTAAGVEFAMPKGAFYFFVKAPGCDDLAFTDALYEERILVVPGRGFGGPGYVRLSCSVDEQIIARSAEGFKRAVAKMKG